MEITDYHHNHETIRRARLLKKGGRLLGMASIVLALLSGYFSAGYPWIGLLLFCCTPLSLYLILRHKGCMPLDMDPASGLPGMFFIPLIVAVGLMAACTFIEVLHYIDVLVPAAVIFVVLTLIMWKCTYYFKRNKKLFYTVFVIMLLSFIGNGVYLTLLLNKLLGYMAPIYYEAIVREKSSSSGDGITFYTLKLGPWAHSPENEHVTVRKSVYLMLKENDRVGIYYQKGMLGIPWYEVVDRR